MFLGLLGKEIQGDLNTYLKSIPVNLSLIAHISLLAELSISKGKLWAAQGIFVEAGLLLLF